MTYDDFNAFCGALPATTYGMQWGGAHVWKVGDKIFAVGGWEEAQAGLPSRRPPLPMKSSKISRVSVQRPTSQRAAFAGFNTTQNRDFRTAN
jgi:predicted DNA-binding protein (MmcQ/YjbR family)